MKFANKEQCLEQMNQWVFDRTDEYIKRYEAPTRPNDPYSGREKPEPLTYDTIQQVPEDIERIIMDMSGHKVEYERRWAMWFNERIHHITQSLSIIGQLVRQSWDWDCKQGVFQYGRAALKQMLQRDIDRLQKLVDEL